MLAIEMLTLLGGGIVVAWLLILLMVFLLDLPAHICGWAYDLRTRKDNR